MAQRLHLSSLVSHSLYAISRNKRTNFSCQLAWEKKKTTADAISSSLCAWNANVACATVMQCVFSCALVVFLFWCFFFLF